MKTITSEDLTRAELAQLERARKFLGWNIRVKYGKNAYFSGRLVDVTLNLFTFHITVESTSGARMEFDTRHIKTFLP